MLIQVESTVSWEELCLHQSWLNDPEISQWRSSKNKLYNKDEIEKWYRKVSKDPTSMHFKIFKSKSLKDITHKKLFPFEDDNGFETDKWIGMISLQRINHVDSNAEIAFYIGNTTEHGKGYISEAINGIVEYGFNNLNLHRIYGATPNPAAKKAFIKCGFTKEGEQVEAFKINNKYVNHYNYYILNPKK